MKGAIGNEMFIINDKIVNTMSDGEFFGEMALIKSTTRMVDVKAKSYCKIYFLERNFIFKNFSESQKFVNEVGNISEVQGHHPDIIFGWGYAKVQIFTHKIKGLVESDFILAAKINKI